MPRLAERARATQHGFSFTGKSLSYSPPLCLFLLSFKMHLSHSFSLSLSSDYYTDVICCKAVLVESAQLPSELVQDLFNRGLCWACRFEGPGRTTQASSCMRLLTVTSLPPPRSVMMSSAANMGALDWARPKAGQHCEVSLVDMILTLTD